MAINDMPPLTDMATLWRIYLDLVEINPQERIPQTRGVSLSDIRRIMVAEHFTKRLDWIVHTINRELTVEQAFPCALKRDARYELRIKRDDGKFFLMLFVGRYAARKFIEAVINGREVLDLSYETIMTADEAVRITSTKLRAILNHEYTDDERKWQLPLPYNYYARIAATGDTKYSSVDASRERELSKTGAPTRSKRGKRDVPPASSTDNIPPSQPKRASKQYTRNEGTFGIPELAAELKLNPSKVRALLRSRVTKPQEGWSWPIDDFKEILKKIR